MITYRLVMPDGEEFTLNEIGIAVDIGIPEGFGLPSVTHSMRKPYQFEGGLLNSVVVEPRVITLSTRIGGTDRMDLHRLRSRLWNAVRWNRTASNPPDAMQLFYQTDYGAAYLNVYYLTDVIASVERNDTMQIIGIKLIAYDPIWHAAVENETCPLEIGLDLSIEWIVAKRNNAWSILGIPTAAATARTVYDVLYDGDYVYIVGDFATWDNPADPNQRYISRYTRATGVWDPLGTGGAGAGLIAYKLLKTNEDTIIAVGSFTSMGGAPLSAYIAEWILGINIWQHVGGGSGAGAVTDVRDIKYMRDGRLVIVGNFTNWQGIAAADYLVTFDEQTYTWAALGSGGTAQPYCVEVGPDGTVYIGGSFLNWAGAAANDYIAQWNTITLAWSNVGSAIDGAVWCLYFDTATGYLYAGGAFTENVKYWNGSAWMSMAGGANGIVYTLEKDEDGNIVAGGAFTTIGGVTVNRLARWNGTAWSYTEIALPANVTSVRSLGFFDGEIWIGANATNPGTATVSESNTLQTLGNANSYPIFSLSGPMTLNIIRNNSTGKEIVFNCRLNPGEPATLDLSPGAKTFIGSWRGNLLQYAQVLPLSDMGTFYLGSDPEVDNGNNYISILATGTTPYETGDLAGRLSGWANITGLTCENSEHGKIYVEIEAAGGGFFHVLIFRSPPWFVLEQIAHTADYNAIGAQALIADNASGVGGSITIDSVGMEDGILVFYPMVSVTWRDSYLDADTAVL